MTNIYDLKSGDKITPEPLPRISARRQARIQRVQDMWESGAKTKEIAQFFGLSVRQIQKDLIDAKCLSRALIRDWDAESTLGAEVAFLKRLRRKAMRSYSMAQLESSQIGFLRLAVEITGKLIDLMARTGLLVTVPQKVSIVDENPFSDPDLRRRFMDILLEARRSGTTIPGL